MVWGASSAGASDVKVAFNGGGAGAQALKTGFVVLATPSVTSTTPLAGYVSSTITVTGANFVTSQQDGAVTCSAVVGGAAAGCVLIDATTAKITIGEGTSVGASAVQVTIETAGASSPHNVGTSSGSLLTVLSAPSASTFSPLTGYQSSSITVTGANFITAAQGGVCSAVVGGASAASCSISSATSLIVVLGASIAGASDVNVTFNGGGAGGPACALYTSYAADAPTRLSL